MKARSIKNPEVRAVMAAMDRAIASPLCDDSGLAHCVASSIVSLGSCCDLFDMPSERRKWKPAELRAVILAYAQHAPPRLLEAMAIDAKKMLAWVEWWEIEGNDIAEGHTPRTVAA